MESDTKALIIAGFLVAITSLLLFLLCIYLGFKETKKNGILKENTSVKEALSVLLFGGYSVASEGHAWVRWTLPLWIALCMAVFVKGQLLYSWGIQYWIGSGDLKYGDSYSYNIDTSVSALWDENAELFAVVLAGFSLIWPHVKLFYALTLYYLPLQIGDKSRVSLYLWLDTLGRWNHLDIIVVNFMLALIDAEFKDQRTGATLIDVYTYTEDGCYVYCLAVCFSQGLGHLLIEETRYAIERRNGQEAKSLTPSGARKGPSEEHYGSMKQKQPGETTHTWRMCDEAASLYPRAEYFVPAMQLFSAVLYLIAMCINAYTATYMLPLNLSIDDRHLTINEVTVRGMESHANEWYDRMGVIFIGLLVLCFTVISPCIRKLCQLWQWFGAMSDKQHRSLDHVIEIATLWSALDVSLLAGYLCNLELKPLTKSLLDCPTDEDCFYVDLAVKMGFFLAIVAVLTGYAVNIIMAHILHAVKDKKTCIDEMSPLNIDM